jgi:heterodisulfide reductase subunit B
MKAYAYFPGCSLETMAESYDLSTRETLQVLGIELRELEDWNCCGATAYFHVDEILAHALCARNLAMAESMALDLVAPCSGCYKNLYFTNLHLQKDPDLAEHINAALSEDQLHCAGTGRILHLLEVFVKEIGVAEVRKHVTHPLRGLRVAPYYGCQIVRPPKEGQPLERPHYFEELIEATGATPVEFPHKLRCCGGSLIVTNRRAALTILHELLQSAAAMQAQVIATVCPLCQINLECYQRQVNQEFGTAFQIPIMYFTQLVGLSFGIPEKRLGIGRELISLEPALACRA